MNAPVKQHLIDPEICIRCHACEEACPIDAITHNDDNVVVDASICGFCMACISPCPTGAIDSWRMVEKVSSLEAQFGWMELPDQALLAEKDGSSDAFDDAVGRLLKEAHAGAGGKTIAPHSASKPHVNRYNFSNPAMARVQGNFRLTAEGADADVRHIILDLADCQFPVLEGQSIGIIAPSENGKPNLPRLYSISSPRDGERPNTNNLSITVKRETDGVCSNYLCDLERGDEVLISGPFGSTFLMPDDPNANIIMICTGTGSSPFRAFTVRKQRTTPDAINKLTLYFGARTTDSLPYFGPLKKLPVTFMTTHFCLSREPDQPKEYVQDRMIKEKQSLSELLPLPDTYIYLCGLKAMETGVEAAFDEVGDFAGLSWKTIRDTMREEGRYHVETY